MKRSLKLFLFLFTAWLLTMCDTNVCGCVIYDLGITVAIEDTDGNDLLDPTRESHLEEHDITLYHEIKGELRTYQSISKGEGLILETGGGHNHVFIRSNATAGNKVVTVLRVKDHPDIRIVTKVNGENGARVEKIWYKDQLVWPVAGNDGFRSITVTLE